MKIVNNASCTNAPACAKNKWMLSHHYKQINIIHKCIVTKLIGNHWYWIIFLQQTPKPVQTPLLQTHFRMMAIRTHRFKLRCNTMKWTDMKTNSKSIPNLWKCKCKMQLTWLHYQLLRKNENWEMEPKKLWDVIMNSKTTTLISRNISFFLFRISLTYNCFETFGAQ